MISPSSTEQTAGTNYKLQTTNYTLALVADWLTVFGGAEHAIAEFHRLWPAAPLYTTVARRERLGPLSGADIRPTRLQKWYRLLGKHQLLLPFMPRAVEDIDLDSYDVILSSSHAVGKGIIPSSRTVHICYCHTPMRYAWEMEDQYLEDFRVPTILRRHVRRHLRTLRRWDLSTAKRVDVFIANSQETQRRIRDIYGHDSLVIPPPVSDDFFAFPLTEPRDRSFFLAVGRLVPYKRFDLLIEVANARKLPLVIVGTGQQEARLRRMAGPTVNIRGYVPSAELPSLYSAAKAVFFPQHEDAGIVPLEAQACGTPVIAYAQGGALDTVVANETGLFFGEQTVESLDQVLNLFSQTVFDPHHIRLHAKKFSAEKFRVQMLAVVQKAVSERQRRSR